MYSTLPVPTQAPMQGWAMLKEGCFGPDPGGHSRPWKLEAVHATVFCNKFNSKFLGQSPQNCRYGKEVGGKESGVDLHWALNQTGVGIMKKLNE